ncbi:MAG: asnB [Bacilli bacterium]|nr:asnB [Bacilli bacterium]
MCGIAGIIQKNGHPCDKQVLTEMMNRIIHRGPDDQGLFVDGPAGLGFRRLSIIDVEGGHQPLTNEDGSLWLIFNGEIYNYQSLRADLVARGHEFTTFSDSEVLLHLFEEKGVDMVRELRGMFSFAIWNQNDQTLFAARDHFGIKPFYYTVTQDAIAFGSEIKSLLEVPGVKREVDREALWNYLTFQFVPDPMTMFQGIYKLPPAHYMLLRQDQIQIKKYWQAEFQPEDRPLSEYAEKVEEVLRNSVKVHMNSDVPRGAFLSSGVDSSTIVALLRELEQVQTFTVGFEGAGGQSEIGFARETAKLLGTTHRDTIITAQEYREQLPRLLYNQDEPVADPSAIALYFVSELASRYVTVVLSGEGADEIFGGYSIYREPLSLKMFDYLPPSLRRSLGKFSHFLPYGMKGRSFLERGAKTVQERFVGNAFIFTEAMKEQIASFRPDAGSKRPFDITQPLYEQASAYDDVTKMQFIDLHTWLPGDILMKADKMTMANSLELRVPFLDVEVFALASKIPMEYRMREGTTKYVLREAVKGILPEPVTKRPKLGFPVPTRQWLRGEFYKWAEEVIMGSPTDELINKEAVLHLLQVHREGKRDYGRPIWTVLVFMLWHQIYLEGPIAFHSAASPNVELRRSGAVTMA